MAGARNESLITAIDIGSWKVSALIARKTESGGLVVLGTGQRESRGVRRGFVADMERTEVAVRETIEQAEKVAGTNIEKVVLSFSAGSIESKVEPVEMAIGGRAMAIWYLIERACFSESSAVSRSLTTRCGSCWRFTAEATISSWAARMPKSFRSPIVVMIALRSIIRSPS